MSRHIRYSAIAAAFTVSLACGGVSDALAAKKKMSYQEAFAKCKQELGGGPLGGEALNTAGRYAAAGGCMQKYGFRLKKKAKI